MASPEIPIPIVREPPNPIQEQRFQNTLDFLAEATPNPSAIIRPWPPRSKNLTEANWQRNFTIAGRSLGTDATLEKIGNDYHLTKERVRQIAKRCVLVLYKNSDLQTQSRFPLENFSFDKSPTREAKRIKLQRKQNLRKLTIPDLPDYETQKILNTVTRSSYQVLSRGENPVLIAVSDIARNAGLNLDSRNVGIISSFLKKAGIGVGFAPHKSYRRKSGEQIQTGYHFIRTLDRNRAVSMFKQAPEVEHLKINPVTILGKTSGEMPSVNVSKLKSGEFASVMNLIAEIRGRRIGPGSKIKLTDIVEDNCPVSIYQYDKQKRSGSHNTCNVHRYRLEQKEELKTYLSNRLAELGLL